MAKEKIATIEKLAELTQGEFIRIEHKMDSGFKATDEKLKTIVDILDVMRDDMHDIKMAMGPLIRTVAALEETVRILDKRVARLEEKAGFTK